MNDHDTIRRFLFEGFPVRGELVNLDATWQEILNRHDYPPAVRDLLGELMAAAALLSATIKYNGTMIIQLQGEGPISLMVVECSSHRTLRGLAHWSGDVSYGTLSQMVGAGKLVITVDPGEDMERYQGIVGLEGDRIAQALENYLIRSEQLSTYLWLEANENIAAGMLLQRLPVKSSHEDEETIDDAWNRIHLLGETISKDELLTLPAPKILRRLFHQEDVRLFEGEPISFRCSCSRERVRNMLRALGHDEVNKIIDEEGHVKVNCDFCNQLYLFDQVDAEQLFVGETSPDVPSTRH